MKLTNKGDEEDEEEEEPAEVEKPKAAPRKQL